LAVYNIFASITSAIFSEIDGYNAVHQEGKNDKLEDWVQAVFAIILFMVVYIIAVVVIHVVRLEYPQDNKVEIELEEGLVNGLGPR
jgi:hypothetical protein